MYLYIRMGVLMVISLISVRLLLKNLGVVDYGIYSAIGGLVVSFSFISQTLVSASQRFFAIDIGKNDRKSLKKTYDSVLLSYIIIVVIAVALLQSIGRWFVINKMTIPAERLDVALMLFQTTIWTFVMHILTNPYNALIIAYEDMRTYATISLLESCLKFLAAYSLIWITGDRLQIYPILLLSISLIIFCMYYCVCARRYDCVSFKIEVDISRIKHIFSYSSWTIFGTMAGVANNQGLNILLNVFMGPVVNAAYSIAHQTSGLLSQLSNSFFSAVRPPLTKSFASASIEHTHRLFIYSTKVLIILLSITIVPLYVLAEDILTLWLGQVDSYMISFSRILFVYVFILSISAPITTIVQAAGAVKIYHGLVDGFILLTLPMSYIALKLGMAPQSALIIMTFIISIAHIIRLIILKKYLVYSLKNYFLKLIIPAILTVVTIGTFSSALYHLVEQPILQFIVVILPSTCFLAVIFYYIFLDSNERASIIKMIKR